MASPVNDSYSAASGGVIAAGRTLGISRRVLVPDGIYTWCDTTVTAIYRNGATYIGWVNKTGYSGVSKFTHATSVTEHATLTQAGQVEIDDHNMTSLHFRDDGKLVAFFGPHNSSAMLYRVALSAESVSGWGPLNVRTVGYSYSYPHLTRFSKIPNRYFFFSRQWVPDGAGDTRVLAFRTTDRLDGEVGGALPDPWSAPTYLWRNETFIPYYQYVSDGDRVLHVFATDRHPVQGMSSLYHFYMRLDDADVPRGYATDGTELSLPVTPLTGTQVYDGSVAKCWVSDAAIMPDGSAVCLWMRYPGAYGTPIEFWHARYEGGVWVKTFITLDGSGLYTPEIYYHGGLQFDANDPSIIYLSTPIAGKRQIQEWRTADGGATWSLFNQITSGDYTGLRARPYSPRNHNGQLKVIWWEGLYTTFANYDTSIIGGR